jgi:hypothetical protein
MGAGFAQVGLLLLLTVIGLPLFFFALMAALDKFERSFSPQPRVAATPTGANGPADITAASTAPLAVTPEAAVVALPTLPVATSGNAAPASKPAAAV